MNRTKLINIIITGLLIACGIILPQFTGRIPVVGKLLLPMHYPAIICGFVCGYKYGGVCGFVTPLLASLIFSMPPMYPMANSMAF